MLATRPDLPILREARPGPERGGPPRKPWRGGAGSAGGPVFNVSTVVLWLVVLNLAVHLARSLLPENLDARLVYSFGLVAARFTGAMAWGPVDPLPLVTYQFLHGGLDHLGINMLALLAFGVGLERWIGPGRFLVLYLLSGIAGGIAQILLFPGSPVPLLGASAAISGCFAAILRLVAGTGRGAAGGGLRQVGLLAVIWIVSQLLFGLVGAETSLGVVAWWSHIGGFVVGLALIHVLVPRPR
ncbi:MAG: rhomboid family intramembrane serine protease [Alphaproteobacteria bacterium]|nr:rhomboid family intramembrane serine protease [Alphaproteobacteria bacterium]